MKPQLLPEADAPTPNTLDSDPFPLDSTENSYHSDWFLKWEVPDTITFEAAPPKVVLSHHEGIVTPERHNEKGDNNFKQLQSDWVLMILLMSLGLLAYLRTTSNKRLQQLVEAFVSNRFIRQLLREDQAFTNRASVLLTINYWMVTALFLVQLYTGNWLGDIATEITWLQFEPVLFLICFGGVAAIYLFKFVLFQVAGWLFNSLDAVEEYLYNFQLFANVQGLVMLPIVTAMAYLDLENPTVMVVTGAILSLGFLVGRLFKGIYLGITSTNFSWFYIITYICSLEILPLLVLAKPLRPFLTDF
ncbi:MAG: DUF4271 domain-containing protein [Salibacteraceae bacterium]|mgnify:CR=1 FL=1